MARAAQLGIVSNCNQLLAAGCPTSRHATPARFRAESAQFPCRGPGCNGKGVSWIISNVWRWTELQLQWSRGLSKHARKKPGLNIQAEAPSQHTPETSSKSSGDEAVKTVTGSLSSASTKRRLDVPETKEGDLPTSAVVSEATSLSRNRVTNEHFKAETETFLTITVIGATGELATSKIFPALFALFFSGSLPKNVAIFGYSRSLLTDEDLRLLISERLTCRIDDQENCGEQTETFLEKVFYQSGGYESCDNLKTLDGRMKLLEGDKVANRIFYLSVPQDVVLVVSSCLSENVQSEMGWTRLIVEKPFGKDAESSAKITEALLSGFREEQIFRIDHLLGKELIENLTVLRFSNLVFEPLWSRTYIQNVQFIHSEDWGVTEGKGGYFDEHGVIRDLVQSHMLQSIALFAMEPPVSLVGEDIRNEKVKVLRSIRRPTFPDDVSLGQYKASISKDGKSKIRGYVEEPDVNPHSLTPTFVATVLYIDNARWDGVPFLIKAGKGLIKHRVEIRLQFRHVPGNLYREVFGYNLDVATNELILRAQPDEGIFLKINNKVPGLSAKLDTTELNLLYHDKYDYEIPDSYERLILDVIEGDRHLFIRGDELEESWKILTPLLDQIKTLKVVPELYTYGGRGPIGAYFVGATHGVKWADD